MKNHENVDVNITRIDLCNIILACSVISHREGASEKWRVLHDKLKQQLRDSDEKHGD